MLGNNKSTYKWNKRKKFLKENKGKRQLFGKENKSGKLLTRSVVTQAQVINQEEQMRENHYR